MKGIPGFVTGVALLVQLLSVPQVRAAVDQTHAEAIYFRHCAVCHGEQGDGKSRAQFGLDPPPRDFTSAESWHELSRERMIVSVKYGRPGTAMVGWDTRLNDVEIEAVVDYIRDRFMRRPEDTELQLGRRLYKQHCSACHGDRGDGASWAKNSLDPPPRDFTSPVSREALSRERMIVSVTHGRPGTAMMPFASRLSEQEIEAVVYYIRAAFMGDDARTPTSAASAGVRAEEASVAATSSLDRLPPQADMSAPFPHGLRGDAERGRRLFDSNCQACHGLRGDGRGPRADFIRPPPRNFLGKRARRELNRPALFRAISRGRPGTVMPAWSTVLNDQQIADVAEYVFQAFILGSQDGRESGVPDAATTEEKKKVSSHADQRPDRS